MLFNLGKPELLILDDNHIYDHSKLSFSQFSTFKQYYFLSPEILFLSWIEKLNLRVVLLKSIRTQTRMVFAVLLEKVHPNLSPIWLLGIQNIFYIGCACAEFIRKELPLEGTKRPSPVLVLSCLSIVSVLKCRCSSLYAVEGSRVWIMQRVVGVQTGLAPYHPQHTPLHPLFCWILFHFGWLFLDSYWSWMDCDMDCPEKDCEH